MKIPSSKVQPQNTSKKKELDITTDDQQQSGDKRQKYPLFKTAIDPEEL